jgi:hypothetical protein
MKTIVNLFFIFVSLLLLTTSSVAQNAPNWGKVAPLDYSQYGRPQVPVRVLLLIPEEFVRFEYVSTYEGSQIRYMLGEEALRELRIAFRIEFASVEVLPVRSEAEAMAMLTPDDPIDLETRTYDYVVIPKFMRVASSDKHQKYGFDIDLLTEFYAKDGANVTKIKGHGESNTGKWSAATPEEGAKIALQYAVAAILDGVEGNRRLFVH